MMKPPFKASDSAIMCYMQHDLICAPRGLWLHPHDFEVMKYICYVI